MYYIKSTLIAGSFMKTLQHTANQHNTVEHNTILAQITLAKGSLFSDFRVPDMLSTFTWGNEHALDLLFDTTKYIPHDLLFVHNSVVKQFVDSIEHSARSFVPPNGQAGGLEHNVATCIAVWQHGGEHSLVSVANTAFYQWQKSPNLPPFLHVGGIGDYDQYGVFVTQRNRVYRRFVCCTGVFR